MISFAFPPVASAESYVAAKAILGSNEGFISDVIHLEAASNQLPIDSTLQEFCRTRTNTQIAIRQPLWVKFLPKGRLPTSRLKWIGRIPDEFFVCIPQAVTAAMKLIHRHTYSLLITRSMWQSSHLVGLIIKILKPRLPWIVSMSDPWTGNPYHQYGWLLNRLNTFLENIVLTKADIIIVPSQAMAEMLKRKYPRKACVIKTIPHSFDVSLYGSTTDYRSDEFANITLRHLGSFYGARQPDNFLLALKQIYLSNPSLRSRLRIQFIGSFEINRLTSLLRALDLTREVQLLGPVKYLESLNLALSADGLIALDAPSRNLSDALFLPSKIIDYLGAGRPIFAASPVGSPTTEILKKYGHWVTDTVDVDNITSELSKFIASILQGSTGTKYAPPSEFDSRTIRLAWKTLADRLSTEQLTTN